MRRLMLAVVVVMALVAGLHLARADMATPFVEINNKVGDVSESHGYVLANEGDDEHFMVLVRNDSGQFLAIQATAEKGAVPTGAIGRFAVIKAEVTKASAKREVAGMQLKILGVTVVKAKPATTRGN